MRGLKFRGRPPLLLADSVLGVINLDNPYAKASMDRSTKIDEDFVNAIVAQAGFSWEGRNPAPALDQDGNFRCTDLDLLSFLIPLADRGGVIEFPKYDPRRPPVLQKNERRIGTSSRFGQATAMTSNQKFFSFSIRIIDNSVIVRDPLTQREEPGAYRNFMVVAPEGNWHSGWEKIIFNPTAEENKFLTEKGLWTSNTVYFKNAVHPNRWQSVFGAPYLLLKMLCSRLAEERKYYGDIAASLKNKGFELPAGEIAQSEPSQPSGIMQAKRTVPGIEIELDLPNLAGSFPSVPESAEGLLVAHRRAKEISYTLKPKAQLVARADELAYFLNGYQEKRIAPWMSRRSFKDYTPPRGKIIWQQMVLSNEVSLRIRQTSFTDTVAVKDFAA